MNKAAIGGGAFLFCALLIGSAIWWEKGRQAPAAEPQEDKNHHHRKQVRLKDKEIIRPVNIINLGEGPLWCQTNALVVDRDGYMWMRSNAWMYPMRIKETPVEVMPDVTGVQIKMKREDFPMPVAEMKPANCKGHGMIPVIKLTYED